MLFGAMFGAIFGTLFGPTEAPVVTLTAVAEWQQVSTVVEFQDYNAPEQG